MIKGFRALVNWGYRIGYALSGRHSIPVVKAQVTTVGEGKSVCCLCRKNGATIKGYCQFCYEAIQTLKRGKTKE